VERKGIHARLYLNTVADPPGPPVWNPMNLIGECSVSVAWNTAEAKTRATPVVRTARTTVPLTVTGKLLVDDDDAQYLVFDAAHFDSTKLLDILVLNGDIASNGVTGYRFFAELTSWTESQGTDEIVMKDFELKPGLYSTTLPQRAKVTAGAPVYSPFV
jgi:hypothetical protein